jgi:ABC-2 type transport system permease protein
MDFRNISLIAGREIRERMAAKSFKYGTLFTMVLVVAGVVGPALLGNDDDTRTVAIAQPATPELTEAVNAAGVITGSEIETVTVDDVAAGEELVRNDEASLLIDPSGELVVATEPSEAGGGVDVLTASIAERLRLLGILNEAGLEGEAANQALAAPGPEIRGLEPAPERTGEQIAAATAALVIVFVFVLIYGGWVLNGVIEDKTSRVVEVLLATVKPAELLVGKVAGIAATAGVQGGAVFIAAIGAYLALPENAGETLITPELAATTLLWLTLGFGVYSWLYAAAGSLASRSQEAQSISLPLQVPLIAAYIVSFGVLTAGSSNILVTISSYVPFTAPMTMLSRMLVESVPAWQVAISVAVTLVGIAIIAKVAVVIFSRSILRTGKRTKMMEALRSPAT